MNFEEKCRYTRPSNEFITKCLAGFDLAFTGYCNTVGYLVDASYDREAVINALIRMDQRQYYHYVFHRMPRGLNEIKQAAIFCFWLLKYRPIICRFRDKTHQEKMDKDARRAYEFALEYFTERFCLHFLDNINWYFKGTSIDLTGSNRAELEYGLRHADISKEALTLIFEILADVGARLSTAYDIE